MMGKDNEPVFKVLKSRIHDETMLTIDMSEYVKDDVEATMKLVEMIKEYSENQLESMQKAEELVASFKETFPRLDYMTTKTGYNIGELNTELAKLRPTSNYKISPLYHDYIRPLIPPGSEMDYEAMARRLKEVARSKEKCPKYRIPECGYVETPSGSRRNLSK